jgi:ribulose-phosphate 3-epimerase
MQKVIPAILTNDAKKLQEQLQVLKDQSYWVHIDIMDGKFVPAVSINLAELRDANQLFNLEIHLMVKEPEKYLESCNTIGAKRVYFHLEGAKDPKAVLLAMEQYQFERGIAINPETTVEQLTPYVKNVDAVLLLSIVPGAQGNTFIPEVAEKILEIKGLNEKLLVGMDGGVGEGNIQDIFTKGADYIVAGSAVWKAKDPIVSLRELQEMIY